LKPRIAVIDDAGFGLSGGRGIFGKEVYSELLARINEEYLGNEVFRVLLGYGASEVPVYRFTGSKIPIVRVIADRGLEEGLTRFFREKRIDIVHANILNPRYVIPLLRAVKRSGAGLVYTVHSYTPLCPINWKTYIPSMKPCTYRYPSSKCLWCIHEWRKRFNESSTKALRGLMQIELIRKLMGEADAVISPSERFAEIARRELNVETRYILNPLNPSLLDEGASSRAENRGYALFIGRLEYEKGVHLLPEIAKLINPVELHVAGQGRLADYIEKNKPQNLVFHGYVDPETKAKLYRGTTVVVAPSIWMEMFGYTVVEAFAYSKPVVAFNHAGPGELIEKSGGGLLAKPFDVYELAQNTRRFVEEGLTEMLGLKGREFVERQLHPAKYAQELSKIYTSI